MAGSKSDYLENKVLDHVLKNTAYTSPSAVYMGLFTSAPGEAGGGTEVAGNNYSRKSITFGSASSGSSTNSADVTFNTPSATWGTVTGFGIFDASTSGNLLYYGTLAVSKTINQGDVVQFPSSSITVTED